MAKAFESHAKMRIPVKNPFKVIHGVFNDTVLPVTKKAAWDIAEEYVEELKETVYKQLWNWKPLNEDYLKSKISGGLDPRIFIARGDFVKAIGVYPTADGQPRIGFPEDDYHPRAKIGLRLLARFLEFGTSKMPARPLWRPMHSIAVRRMKITARQLREKAERALQRELKKKLRTVTR